MALLLGLAMLPAGAIAMQVGLNAVEARQTAYAEALSRRALQSITIERGTMDELREILRVLASTPALRQIEAGDCREWFGNVMSRYPYLASMSFTTDQGTIRCSVPTGPANLRAPNSALRRLARTRDAYSVGYVEQSALLGKPVLAALEPVRDESGRRIGFLSASLRVDYLRALMDRGRALDRARAALIDSEGRVIAETSSTVELNRVGLPSAAQVRNHLGPDPSFVQVQGGAAIVAPLQAPDLYIVLAWPPEGPVWRRWMELAISLVAPVLIWLLAISAGWFAIELYVARPLSNLEAAARSYARGEEVTPESSALVTAPDEIRSLRRTLAAMAKTLRGREQRLVEALAEERALLREVHHRVKNNLQMVASLLNIQARGADDESEARGLARAHERVQLLALVHQKIYASGEVRELRVDELAMDIARNLMQSRGLQGLGVNFTFDPVRADVDRAVPFAFLIGEGLGRVFDALAEQLAPPAVYLHQDESGEVRFAIAYDREKAPEATPSDRLIDAFARQLGAEVGRDPARPFMLWVRIRPVSA